MEKKVAMEKSDVTQLVHKRVFSHLLYRIVREMCYDYVLREELGVVDDNLEEMINQRSLAFQLSFDNLIDNIKEYLENE